jgi:uncharacterized repeat protein (TIGR02543 family)
MKKRILSIILVLLMAAALLLSFSLPAMAAFSATIRMTLDGQPMSPTAIVSSDTTLFAYTPTLSFSQFTESPTGTFTASNIQDDANTLAIGNGGGYTNIRDRLVDFHSMVSKTPFTISNTTAYPLTLVFYSVSYKPGTYAKETTSTYKRIAAEGRGQYAQNSTYTRDGYIQIGWSTDPDGTSKTYDFGTEIYPTSAMNLYPAWAEPTFPVTVKVNKDGSAWTGHGKSLALYQSGAKKYDLAVSGSSATVSALAGTYDIYEGTSDTGVDVTVSNGGANSATVNYYTLTLSAGAGTSSPTGGGIYLAGKSVPIDATVNPGYTWSKWTSSSTGLLSDQSTKATNISMPVGAVTLTAMSTPNTYTITWRKTAGEVIDTTTVTYGGTPTHSDPTNPGYNFAGWNPSVVSVTGDATYTAQWTPATYSINYTLNGGTATNPADYTFPNPAITLNNPTRAGYSFVGWSGTDLTGNTNQTVTIVAGSTGDKSYTSNWKANAPSAPLASIVTAKTDRSFTITTQTWYEYSVDGTNWHSGTDGSYTFAGLTAGTAYNLFCRVAAVTSGDTSAASNASDPLTVTTKSTGSVPTPTLASVNYASAKTLADITLPSGWAWSAPATVPTVAINSYSAVYTPTDTTTVDYSGEAGYANASGTVTVTRSIALTINRATPTAADFNYTAPAALDYSTAAKTAAVAAKGGTSGMGAVMVKYYQGGTEIAAPTNAGTYTVKIDIAQSDNYAAATGITDDAWTFTIARVAQAPLSITNKPAGTTYGDSFTLAAAGGSGTGAVTWAVTDGDSATVHTLTGEVTITGVGETTITVTKAADGNYTAPVTDAYTFTPTKLQLTVALPSATGGWTKTYDGGTAFDISAIKVGGMMNSVWTDDVTVLVASATYDTANVSAGDKILTITYAINGADSGNYTVPADTAVNTASITAATPTAADFTYTAPAALDYSGTAKTAAVAAKASISGMGAVTVRYYLGTAETTPTNAGTYTVKIDITQGDNYAAATGITDDTWTFNIARVAQAPLSITNKPAGITYGDSFTLAAVGGSGTGEMTWAVTNGDSATVDTLTGEVTITGVGETTLTATKAADGNYTAPVTDTYTITPTRFQLIVALPSATGGWTKTYDGGTAFDTSAITVGGMKNSVWSDDVTVLVASATYDTANVGAGDKILTIIYAIDGADSQNYAAPADTAVNTASITAAIPTVALVRKTSTYTGSIIHVGAASVTGVSSENDITANYAGAVTYTYYTKDTCTDADKTTVDKSGALAVGGAPKNAGTYYVKATITANGNYTEAASTVTTLTIYYRSSGEDKSSSPVIVDGKAFDIGTTEVTDNTITVVVDQNKMTERLNNVKDSVVIPITAKTDTASAQLVVQNVERMAERDVTLTIIAGDVSYSIPSGAIDTSAVLEALDALDSSKVPLTIAISKLPNSSVTIQNGTLMVPPIAFTITATYNGKSVTVERFGSYVQRVIEIPDGTDPKTITTAVVVEADGTQRHVPTDVYSENGNWYARINTMTNSTYALIHNSVSFADTKDKWYDASVTEMASRGIISGNGENTFDGERAITRAEFTAILVRALGLPSDSIAAEAFRDVSANQWYYGSVGTAYEYGLVTDKGDGLFDPTGNITKQEAMVMIANAAELAGYEDTVDNSTGFSDVDKIVAWAFDAVKLNVSSGLIVGSNDQIHPTDNISNAETAVVILRFLQTAKLVDVRN